MKREAEVSGGDPKPLRFGIAQGVCRRLPPIVSARVRHWIYPQRLSAKDHHEFVVRSVTGGELCGVTSDYFTYAFGVHGYYEWRLLAIALALFQPGDTIVEVGANVGTETVGYADIAGDRGKVIALEPLAALRHKLEELVQRNGYRNLTVLPYALGSKCGQVEFTLPSEENSGLGYVLHEGMSAPLGMPRVKVELRTLDVLADQLGPARLIFADIEGSEHAMLIGGRRYLAAHQPSLVLEAHAKNTSQLGTTLRALHAELRDQEYDVYCLTRLGLAAPDLDSEELMTWFCVHKNRRADVARVRGALVRCGVMPVVHGLNPLALV